MTTADLIAALATYPPTLPVVIGHEDHLTDALEVSTIPALLNPTGSHDRMNFPDATDGLLPDEHLTDVVEIR